MEKCKRKMKCLVDKYKECKDWNQKQSGGSIWKSLHYDEVDAVLGVRDLVMFSNVAGAGSESSNTTSQEESSSGTPSPSPSPSPANTSSSSVESEKESRRMGKKRKTPQTPDTENETEKVMKKWEKCKRLWQNNGYDDQIYGGHAWNFNQRQLLIWT